MVLVCVCVFVCVCACVYTFPPAGFFRLQDFFDVLEMFWSFAVSISRGICQVTSSLFLNLSYFNSKDENSSPQLLERKRYNIIWAREKMIYIDIGYKSAQRQKATVTARDTKDKEATLIQILPCSIKSLVLAWSRSVCLYRT